MDDDILHKLSNGQLPDNEDSNDQKSDQAEKPKPNFAFLTPTEAGYRETDPSKISAAPRPQPGMTFTPTGGSVSNINHQLNRQDVDLKESNDGAQPQNNIQPINNNEPNTNQGNN